MRRLVGAGSLRSDNRCSLGTPPHCRRAVTNSALAGARLAQRVPASSGGSVVVVVGVVSGVVVALSYMGTRRLLRAH